MKSQTPDWDEVIDTVSSLRREVAALSDRIVALEAVVAVKAGVVAAQASVPPPDGEVLSEELVLVISAAIAAFLGKKPRIRQIRPVGSASWGQQGRATIQASHALAGHPR
jgi:methylmalonyl-CoA carboxyltransferase 12S subunit